MAQTSGMQRVERVAHRGMPRDLPENTLQGFLLALEYGADAIELDAHVTRDGVVLVHHDPMLDGVAIASAEWGTLRERRVGGLPVPTLQEVLVAVGDRAHVYVELKGNGVEEAAIAVLRTCGSRFSVHSFNHACIARAALMAPDVPRGILFDRGTGEPIVSMRAATQQTRATDVWPHWTLIDPEFLNVARDLGVRVIAWTVNSLETARHLADLGVTGICTDDVRLLSNL